MLLAQVLVNAAALGAAYALVAAGFVLVLNATKSVNFAQGDMVMAGGFVTVGPIERQIDIFINQERHTMLIDVIRLVTKRIIKGDTDVFNADKAKGDQKDNHNGVID